MSQNIRGESSGRKIIVPIFTLHTLPEGYKLIARQVNSPKGILHDPVIALGDVHAGCSCNKIISLEESVRLVTAHNDSRINCPRGNAYIETHSYAHINSCNASIGWDNHGVVRCPYGKVTIGRFNGGWLIAFRINYRGTVLNSRKLLRIPIGDSNTFNDLTITRVGRNNWKLEHNLPGYKIVVQNLCIRNGRIIMRFSVSESPFLS